MKRNEEILQVLEEKQKCKKCNSELIENELKENDYAYYKMYCEKCKTYTWKENRN